MTRCLLAALALIGCRSTDVPTAPVGSVPVPGVLVDTLAAGPGRALLRLDDRDVDPVARSLRRAVDPVDWSDLVDQRADVLQVLSDDFVATLPAEVVVARTYRNIPVVVVDLPDLAAAERVARTPGLRSIDPDTAFEATLTQSLALIGQPTAAAQGFLGTGTAVAVLDTGADYTRSDLGSCTGVGTPASCRVVYAADFAASDSALDANGHGTNVSSIVAAVAPGTDILALDVFDGTYAYSTDILSAIDWVVTNQAAYNIASINMSLGSGKYTSPCVDGFGSGVDAAHDAGVAVVVASGNNAFTDGIASPACNGNAFSVGAVYDANLGAIGWSGCSETSTAADKVTCFSNSATFLDLLAPGALITAGGYTMGGTSQASPHVAGAMAVMRAADPTATVDELEAQLQTTGVSVLDTRNGLTFPRLDLAAAVADCVQSVSESAVAAAAIGESGSIDLVTDAGCGWSVSSDAGWLTVSPPSGTDSGSFGWTAAANTGGERVGHLSVAGRSVTLTQGADLGPVGSVSIAGGADGTTVAAVTLTLGATDPTGGVSSMCVSNTSSCSVWQTYAATLPWTLLTGSGTKTVYATFKDAYGNVGGSVSDTIVVDTTKPTNGTVTATPVDQGVSLSWTGFADASPGIAGYAVAEALGTTPPTTCGSTVWTGSGASHTVTGLVNGASYGFRVCAVDGAGNVSTGATAVAIAASEVDPPVGTVVLNGGAGYTASSAVTATLSATDASSVVSACLSNTSSCTAWFAMTGTKAWTLATGTGTKTVSAWFKDANGNVSSATSDTIVVDTTKPTNGTVAATGASGSMSLSWTGFTDANGIASYKVVYGTALPASCTAGTVAYSGSASTTTITGLTNGTSYSARVCATDPAGNQSSGATAALTVAPEYDAPVGTVTLAGGTAWTRVTKVDVALSATDATGVSSMCLSTGPSCSTFVPFATATTTTLTSTPGTKTLYATFKDPYGNVSAPVSDTVGYDSVAPTGGSVVATSGDGQISLALTGFTDVTSGVASYKVVYAPTTAPANCSTGTTAYTGSGTTPVVTGLTNGTTYGFRACATDNAGNASSGVVTTSIPAPEHDAPTGTVVVDAGATWTNVRTLNLALTATDASSVAKMCVATGSTCTSWKTFATSTTLAAAAGDGTRSANVWFEDSWGNRSAAPVSDGVGVDSTAPKNGTVTAAAGSASVTLAWTGFSDVTSGVASYKVVYQAGTSPTTCSAGTVAYTGTGTGSIVSGLTAGTKYFFRACALDVAGNVSSGAVANATAL